MNMNVHAPNTVFDTRLELLVIFRSSMCIKKLPESSSQFRPLNCKNICHLTNQELKYFFLKTPREEMIFGKYYDTKQLKIVTLDKPAGKSYMLQACMQGNFLMKPRNLKKIAVVNIVEIHCSFCYKIQTAKKIFCSGHSLVSFHTLI